MSEIVTTARTARELLAKGLGGLQANPGVLPQHLEAAEPIAAAMGALHRIERSAGADVGTAAPQALDSIRKALGILQASATQDPSMVSVMETVASSLGHAFALTRMQPPAAGQPAVPAAPAQQPAPQAPVVQAWQPQPAAQPQPAQPAWQQPPAAQSQPAQPAWQQPPAAQPQPAQPAWQQPPAAQPQPAQPAWQPQPAAQPQPAQPAWQPQPAAPYAPPPQAAPYAPPQAAQPWQQASAPQAAPYAPPPPAAQPWQQPAPQPAPNAAAQPDPFAQRPAAPAQPVPAQPAPPGPAPSPYAVAPKYPLIEAELGTHSPTNFYKGLSGNDVVDHGGIFVATYKIPSVGETLRVHVSLPGGYEFEAVGVVRWTRESRDSMTTEISPPGFGLQFTQISPEARQLVYRYARNREPLFHDDL